MRESSFCYVKIVEELTQRAMAEHEKDFLFRFFPYILSHAMYFGFYYLCPGSRHLYTKSFRKTLLLQVVQILHGIQLCPISVKVTWARLFPDEVQEENDQEVEEEVFPISLAFPSEEFSATSRSDTLGRSRTAGATGGEEGMEEAMSSSNPTSRPGRLAGEEGEEVRGAGAGAGTVTGRPGSANNALDATTSSRLGVSHGATAGIGMGKRSASMTNALATSGPPPSVGVPTMEPLSRTILSKPPTRPGGPKGMLPRHMGEALNVKYDTSPHEDTSLRLTF